MQELLTFDDVLIVPKFSIIKSRLDVDLFERYSQDNRLIANSWLPIMSANMDTVTGVTMSKAMTSMGGHSCLHRFWTSEENVSAYSAAPDAWVSVGLGDAEVIRTAALYDAGARRFILDVAHGAQSRVVEQYKYLKESFPESFIVVGNFATGQSVTDFFLWLNVELGANLAIDGVKVGVGPGSACTTRVKTGCGVPQLSAIQDVRKAFKGLLIGDGGCRTAGDVVKALAAGADLVMLGGMLAGTDETPGEVTEILSSKEMEWQGSPQYSVLSHVTEKVKKYRGSASKESYGVQGKTQAYITAEGESFTVPYKGSVKHILADIEGGLRSACTYVGARSLKEFREKAELVKITNASHIEGTPHGKIS